MSSFLLEDHGDGGGSFAVLSDNVYYPLALVMDASFGAGFMFTARETKSN